MPGLSSAEWRRRALDSFPEIKKDQEAFRVIVHHLGLSETASLSDEQKFLIYTEFKKLRGAVQVEPLDDQFRFTVDLKEDGRRLSSRTYKSKRLNSNLKTRKHILYVSVITFEVKLRRRMLLVVKNLYITQ